MAMTLDLFKQSYRIIQRYTVYVYYSVSVLTYSRYLPLVAFSSGIIQGDHERIFFVIRQVSVCTFMRTSSVKISLQMVGSLVGS